MPITHAHSTKTSVKEAVADLQAQLEPGKPKLVIYFASSSFSLAELGATLQRALPSTKLIGCTTSGEIISGKMLKGAVVAMGLGADIVADAAVELVESTQEPANIKAAMKKLGQHHGETMQKMSHEKYVGLVLIDGLSTCEEKVMDCIGDLTNVTFIGASAGDDLKFKQTMVAVGERAASKATALALLKPARPFDVIKTQSFRTLKKELVATKVKESTREVLEFNEKPAAKAYADAVGSTVADLAKHFQHHPLGLVSDGEIFVRSPMQVRGDGVVFYCQVLEGMKMTVLEGTDIVHDTRKAIEDKRGEMGTISGIINFHCILRTLELEQKKETEAYGRLFVEIPTVGFSTYGEAYIGHINQTSTMLVFG